MAVLARKAIGEMVSNVQISVKRTANFVTKTALAGTMVAPITVNAVRVTKEPAPTVLISMSASTLSSVALPNKIENVLTLKEDSHVIVLTDFKTCMKVLRTVQT